MVGSKQEHNVCAPHFTNLMCYIRNSKNTWVNSDIYIYNRHGSSNALEVVQVLDIYNRHASSNVLEVMRISHISCYNIETNNQL